MVEFDAFRQALATSLLACADRRRRASADPTSACDREAIGLCERLAADAWNLDVHVFLLCQLMLTHRHLARRFAARRDHLFAEVGTIVRPASATALLRWMIRRTLDDDLGGRTRDSRRPRVGAPPWSAPSMQPDVPWPARPTAPGTAAEDVRAWFGIAAPVLGIIEIGRGIGQWQDQHLAGARPPVPATVVAAEPIDSLRHRSFASDVLLDFQASPASARCRVPVRIGTAPQPEVGSALMVVPRSDLCEAPLLASDVGSPLVALLLGAALLIGGAGALARRGRSNLPGLAGIVRPQRQAGFRSRTLMGEARGVAAGSCKMHMERLCGDG